MALSGAGGAGGGGDSWCHEAPIKASNSCWTSSSSCAMRSVNASSNQRSHSGDSPVFALLMPVTPPHVRDSGSGVDPLVLGLLPPRHGDLPRLGLLGDRDPQHQHAVVIRGLGVVGVKGVAKEKLPGEHTERQF